MDHAVLIDEHDDESIYRFETTQGTKYLFKIVKIFNRNNEEIGKSIEYFQRQEWHQLAKRKTTNHSYCVKLAESLLKALPEEKHS